MKSINLLDLTARRLAGRGKRVSMCKAVFRRESHVVRRVSLAQTGGN